MIRYKIASVLIFILLALSLVSTIVHSKSFSTDIIECSQTEMIDSEIHLLRVEHFLELTSTSDIDTNFYISYAFPPDYQYQVPIMMTVFEDSTADILNYRIEEDSNKPNLLVNFTLGSIHVNNNPLVHFTCWVLVKNHEYHDLPEYKNFPLKSDLPDETKKWITSTDVVQSNNPFIKLKASQIRADRTNLIEYAGEIAPFIKEHRYFLFVLQLQLGLFLSQDAVTTLFINGENVGRSHLACALLRTYNVPSRVLLVNNDQGFWTQMHYMAEYYCPVYGWVLIETTRGESPYATKRQVVNRVCYPSDEMNTKYDYIFPFMKGEERWIWIHHKDVEPHFIDCQRGSKSQMFSEAVVTVNDFTADYALQTTRKVFHQYQQYIGMDLNPEDTSYVENATEFQIYAIEELQQEGDMNSYLFYMDLAYDEYKKIHDNS